MCGQSLAAPVSAHARPPCHVSSDSDAQLEGEWEQSPLVLGECSVAVPAASLLLRCMLLSAVCVCSRLTASAERARHLAEVTASINVTECDYDSPAGINVTRTPRHAKEGEGGRRRDRAVGGARLHAGGIEREAVHDHGGVALRSALAALGQLREACQDR